MKKTVSLLLAVLLLASVSLPVLAAGGGNVYLQGETSLAKIGSLQISTGGKAKQLVLKWSAVPRANGYQILRSTTGKTGSYKKIADNSDTAYIDTGLSHSTAYYYAVRAYAWNGEKTIYSPYKKANLSTRISKSYAVKRFSAAYKAMNTIGLYINFNESLQANEDGGYYRLTLKGCNSNAQFRKYLQKYFSKELASRIFPKYREKNGDFYLWIPSGIGGATFLKINKTTVSKLKYTDTKVQMRINEKYGVYGEDGDLSEWTKQALVYENGKWVFDLTGASFWTNNVLYDYIEE